MSPSETSWWKHACRCLLAGVGAALIAGTASAAAASAPQLQASPNPVSFGTVDPATNPHEQIVTLRNSGGAATSALRVTITPATGTPAGVFTVKPGSDRCTGTSLGPNKTCTVIVSYAARAGQADQAT